MRRNRMPGRARPARDRDSYPSRTQRASPRAVNVAAATLGVSLALAAGLQFAAAAPSAPVTSSDAVAPSASDEWAAGGAAATSTTGAVSATTRVDGPFGLWIGMEEDSVRVSWITRPLGAGMLQVRAGDDLVFEGTTPADSVHTLAFPTRDGRVSLHYGSRDNEADRHHTELDLDAGDDRPDVAFGAVDSLFIIGDIHGEWENVTATLRHAGVIDENLRWSAGQAHLAVLGDMTDRGADVTRVLWLLHELEMQARDAGGRVHIVLGNHELMVMLGDLRYVAPKESLLAHLRATTYSDLFDPDRTLLGRWLASKPAVVRIGDALLAHGGVSGAYLGYTVESFDDTLEAYTTHPLFAAWDDSTASVSIDSVTFAHIDEFFWGERSAFWYRGYVQQPDSTDAELRAVLDRFRSSVHVVGHTPGPAVRVLHDGALIGVNTDQFAAEMLLLVRAGDQTLRYRIGMAGPWEPL